MLPLRNLRAADSQQCAFLQINAHSYLSNFLTPCETARTLSRALKTASNWVHREFLGSFISSSYCKVTPILWASLRQGLKEFLPWPVQGIAGSLQSGLIKFHPSQDKAWTHLSDSSRHLRVWVKNLHVAQVWLSRPGKKIKKYLLHITAFSCSKSRKTTGDKLWEIRYVIQYN